MKKYLTKSYYDTITPVEVQRETDESVWVDGRRNAKVCSYARYHDTFDEAKQYLIERHEGAISRARQAIHKAESALGTLRKMTESA